MAFELMAAAAILNFQIFETLTFARVQRADLHHYDRHSPSVILE